MQPAPPVPHVVGEAGVADGRDRAKLDVDGARIAEVAPVAPMAWLLVNVLLAIASFEPYNWLGANPKLSMAPP